VLDQAVVDEPQVHIGIAKGLLQPLAVEPDANTVAAASEDLPVVVGLTGLGEAQRDQRLELLGLLLGGHHQAIVPVVPGLRWQ